MVRLVRRNVLVVREVPRLWIAQTIVRLEILLVIIHENLKLRLRIFRAAFSASYLSSCHRPHLDSRATSLLTK